MSNTHAKEMRSQAKDARQQPPLDGACNGAFRKKAEKPWLVRGPGPFVGNRHIEMTWHKAKSKELGQAWMDKWGRSGMSTEGFRVIHKAFLDD